jgi:hypothetical protein
MFEFNKPKVENSAKTYDRNKKHKKREDFDE